MGQDESIPSESFVIHPILQPRHRDFRFLHLYYLLKRVQCNAVKNMTVQIQSIRNIALALIALSSYSEISQARPEYAIRHGFVSCMQCHVSPVGGGIRNSNGKLYGFKGYESNSLSLNEYYQADVRSAFMHTHGDGIPSRRGFLVMSTNGAVALPIIKSQDGWSTTYVGSYGFGMLETGIRDSYAIFKPDSLTGWVTAVLVGRTKPPFGILTDEHRTYTRVQSRTSFTAGDFDTGVMVSGTPLYSLHYDFMFTSGDRGSGASTGAATNPWGFYANLRTVPWNGPIFLGASYNELGTQTLNYDATATSLWTGIALEKVTFGLVPGTFILEGSRAHGWNNTTLNPTLGRTFGSAAQPAWFTSIADAWSEALLAQLSIYTTPHLTALAKAEQFTPDINLSGDSFFRYGGGVRWYFNSNMNLALIYESSYSTRAGMNGTAGVPAVERFAYALLHIWL